MAEGNLWAVVVGGVLTLAGTIVASEYGRRRERGLKARQLARALTGELQGLLDVAEHRNYKAQLQAAAQRLRAGWDTVFRVPIEGEYMVVFKSAAGDIGLLKGELPQQVAKTYAYIESLLEDVRALRDVKAPLEIQSQVALAARYERLVDMIERTMALARATIDALGKHYL